MAGIVWACITPHPPIIVPEVGQRNLPRVQATVEAMKRLATLVEVADPEVALVITPHGPARREAMGVVVNPALTGSFAQFGAREVAFHFSNDLDLVEAIISEASASGIPVARIVEDEHEALDWGVLVPLYYLARASTMRVVPLTFSWLDYETHHAFGRSIQRAAERSEDRVLLVASGDLSHCLLPGAPGGYHPLAKEFDRQVVHAVESFDTRAFMRLDRTLIERAGECGLRSFIIMSGALEGKRVEPTVLSYEGPFGVGYLVASLRILEN